MRSAASVLAWLGLFCGVLLSPATGNPEDGLAPAERVWDLASRLLRKQPIGGGSQAPRRISVEHAGRRNLFLVSFERRQLHPKGGRPRAGRKGEPSPAITDEQALVILEGWAATLARAQEDFDQGHENRAYDALQSMIEGMEKSAFASQANDVKRLDLLERATKLRGRIETRREFRRRAHQVNFIVFKPEDPGRSVVSIDGELVRPGGAFGAGAVVRAIHKSRVVVEYKGESFEMSLVQAQ